MMIAGTLLLQLAALLLLALASDRHHEPRFGHRCPPRRARAMRRVAWALLAASFVPGVAAWGPVFGWIGTPGLAMLAAGATFLTLNLLPARIRFVPRRGSS